MMPDAAADVKRNVPKAVKADERPAVATFSLACLRTDRIW
jgi:hypothetical protein